MMSEDTIRTVIWAVVALFAIQGAAVYAVAKLVITGKAALYDRRTRNVLTMDGN